MARVEEVGLLSHHVVRDPGERGGGLQGGPQRERLVALGVDAAVPAVHEVAREGELRAHRPGGAQAGVVEGDRVAEEGRAGVVPVVLRFDHLGSDRCHELAGVDLHAGADEDARVGLLDVLVDLLAFRDRAGRALLLRLEERGQVGGPAEPQVGAEADPALGGRHLGEVDLRRAQREGVVLHVVGAQRRVRPVEVVAVVDVHPAAHLDLRLGRGCRRRLGGVGVGVGAGAVAWANEGAAAPRIRTRAAVAARRLSVREARVIIGSLLGICRDNGAARRSHGAPPDLRPISGGSSTSPG